MPTISSIVLQLSTIQSQLVFLFTLSFATHERFINQTFSLCQLKFETYHFFLKIATEIIHGELFTLIGEGCDCCGVGVNACVLMFQLIHMAGNGVTVRIVIILSRTTAIPPIFGSSNRTVCRIIVGIIIRGVPVVWAATTSMHMIIARLSQFCTFSDRIDTRSGVCRRECALNNRIRVVGRPRFGLRAVVSSTGSHVSHVTRFVTIGLISLDVRIFGDFPM
mmetsp:Transcript_47183/g.47623  ORF Transcript_47183/g.47623 Transcript_47183/m.47623 type:complete len:221 (+) Transcript_47183:33-695(+)